MKNYMYTHIIKACGYVEVDESEYTDRQLDMKKFVESMSGIVKSANCGWDGVKYKVMNNNQDYNDAFMVLYCNGGGKRWIPINGNSKGCNFSVLGENLW